MTNKGPNFGGNVKKVILRSLFVGSSHIFDLVTTEDEARTRIEDWHKKAATGGILNGYDRDNDRYYAVKCSEIAAMFTIDIESIKKQQEEARKQAQAGMPSTPPGF